MLTGLLGARKWIRLPAVHFGPDACTYCGQPADFVADIALSYAGEMQLELVMAGGMQFAYVSAAQAGVPYIEIAHIPPDIRAVFDYVKQEQQ